MSETEKKAMETVHNLFLHLSELDKERWLAFCEGMAFKASQQQSRSGERQEGT